MKKLFLLLFIILYSSFEGLAQKCNHAQEVQTLFNQLQANGFDTHQAILYEYFFLDKEEQPLQALKNSLLNKGYQFVNLRKKGAMYELCLAKVEVHTAQSLIKRGGELSSFAKAQGIDTFDGFEIKMDENPSTDTGFKAEVERMNPNDLYKKAIQLYDNHQDAQALLVFDRCIQLGINPAESYYKRANTKTALGRKSEAISDLERALQVNPSYFEASYNLAGLYFEAGNFNKAHSYYQKASNLNPKNDNAWYRLAATEYQLGQRNLALQNCQKALQLNPANSFAKELLLKFK